MSLHSLKAAALASCRYLGVFALSQRLTAAGIRVLGYHRFTPQPNQLRDVESRTLERHLAYLRRHLHPLSATELLGCLSGERPTPPGAALVTIDDGYEDAWRVAYPVLRKYAVPAIIFLPTEFIDHRVWLWPDKLAYALSHTTKRRFDLDVGGGLCGFDLTQGWPRVKWQLDPVCTRLGTPEREALIAQLLLEVGVTLPERPTADYAPLGWPQVKEMASGGLVTFGSHTCSHPILSTLPKEAARSEVAGSKRRLEEELQQEVATFCYPNGTAADFSAETVRLLQESGYRCAFSTVYGLNRPGDDPFRLKRMIQSEAPMSRFLQDVSGLRLLRERLSLQPAKSGITNQCAA